MLDDSLKQFQARHDQFLARHLTGAEPSQRLTDAMRYAALLGGKRVRPFLVYATGEMLGASLDDLDAPAAAIECIHAYSLIHDDLPAMDDDKLRRGQPTCHIQFDEATAILAGDALQSLAFDLLANHPFQHINSDQQIRMVQVLAKNAGREGMCAGQQLDIDATGKKITVGQLEQVHRLKTGALINASVEMGALCTPQDKPLSDKTMKNLQVWSESVGLAFQVKDDLLDATGDTQTLGKTSGSDIALAKSTYPALLGIDGSEKLLSEQSEKALQALASIPYNTTLLEEFTQYLITREH